MGIRRSNFNHVYDIYIEFSMLILHVRVTVAARTAPQNLNGLKQ